MRKFTHVCLLGLIVIATPAPAQQDLLVGGGSRSGVYYQVAAQLCRNVNEYAGQDYNCLGRPSLGSVFNINAVIRGLLDFGIAQSDRNWQASQGLEEWQSTGPVKDLRSVFSVHAESVLLVARRDSDIKTVVDLAGHHVNLGNKGSGSRGNALDVLKIYGIDPQRDLRGEALDQSEAQRALIAGRIDALFYTVGNPNNSIRAIAEAVPIRILNINGPGIRELVRDRSYYVMARLPAGMYPGLEKEVETYAVKATVVTRAAMDSVTVYRLVKVFFSHLDAFRASHPAFANLKARDMLEGLSAPLHPGAVRYFREAGLLSVQGPSG